MQAQRIEGTINIMGIVALICVGYLVLVFPLAYFRHDDWLILGNSVLRLPKDWSFALSPNLFFGEQEINWFFRPLFKTLVYYFYQCFGSTYYLWLVGILGFLVGALLLGSKIVFAVTGSKLASRLFLVLFTASIHFHFGSLVWIGEGIMNCPQLFFLMLNTHCLCSVAFRPGSFWRSSWLQTAAVLSYIIALGFKESSVFHLVFMLTMVLSETRFSTIPTKIRFYLLTPHFILTLAYLAFQLGAVPFNKHYLPQPGFGTMIRPAYIIGLSIAVPLGVWFGVLWFYNRRFYSRAVHSLRARWPYLFFLLLSISPYFGHGFFSPGWLLFPGFYVLLVVALATPLKCKPVLIPHNTLAICLLLVTLSPVLFYVHRNAWWLWHKGQRQLHELVRSAPEGVISELVIFDCPNQSYPHATLERVVMFYAGLHEMWNLYHRTPIGISIRSCEAISRKPASQSKTMALKWEFPEFEVVSKPRGIDGKPAIPP